MNRNRTVVKVAAFLVVCFVGDRVGGYLLGRVFMSTRFRFSELYAGSLPADLMFMGNSRGLHMFHRPALEEVTQQRVTNLSFNGLPATMLPVVFADFIEHQPPPQTLFIEVSCVGRTNEVGALERFRILSYDSTRFSSVHARHAPTDYWASQLSHLYRCNSELLWRSVVFARSSDQDWIMTSVLRDDWEETFWANDPRKFETSAVDMASLQELIRLCDAHGTETTLIFAPYFPEYFGKTRNADQWLSWIEQETGKTVLNYTTAIADPTHFADPIHLNPSGAKQLAELMVERGDLRAKGFK